MSSEGGEKKGLSKTEQKKLAKKAAKDASKKKGGGGGGGAKGGKEAKEAAPPTPIPTQYYLAHGSSNIDDKDATLKASIGSILYNIPLVLSPLPPPSDLAPLLQSPALLCSASSDAVAFGGNAILKSLCLLSSNHVFTSKEDEWLEYERCVLRPAVSSKNAKKINAVLTTLEETLKEKCESVFYLVGSTTTCADVAIVVTLSFIQDAISSTTPTVENYVKHHLSSSAFVTGTSDLSKLLPSNDATSFDTTNPSLLQAVEFVFTQSIRNAFPEALMALGPSILSPDAKVAKCKNAKDGDYQCTSAMPLFQKLKQYGLLPSGCNTPQDVAKYIVKDVEGRGNKIVEDLAVNGPGFILCRITSSYLQTHMNTLIQAGSVPRPRGIKPTTCVVDFSSPNIAKEMHVGHLRSTIIGEAVCRLLEFCGNDVKRINHVGDWGTQFGMLIQFLKEEYPDLKGEGDIDQVNITDLTAFYKKAKERFDESPEFKKMSQTNVVKLQSGDKECLGIWQLLCDISRREFKKVYDRLDITTEECGESFYNDKIPAVIQEFDDAGLISIEEGGAKCIFVPKAPIPLMVQKSDGGFGYDSTDMAALKHRTQTVGAKRIICITDYSQADHFKMCFSAAKMIGWVDPSTHKLEHIGFGTVQGEDGKRFKTRSGDTVRLVDLLDEAVNRMEISLKERIGEGKANITLDEVPETASALGYGAVKYFDLRRNPTTNYIFSYNDMLETNGDTAIYLLYAHARLESICTKGKEKHNVDVDELIKANKATIVVGHPAERNLTLQLQMFADMIESTLDDLFPYHVCEFVYNVSTAVSKFVNQCRVLDSPEMESRLLLCRATAIVMRQCFELLGIRPVMRI
mmetsp:Transcript_61020/g.90490  ORF Transcript_61020/g.90490 Transcript_61020/m.90490 type:complete len:855 (+) Transcript_61020:130-2694(+)